MIKFLFWNIKRQNTTNIGDWLEEIIEVEEPDILLLAESNVNPKFIEAISNLKFIDTRVRGEKYGKQVNLQLYSNNNGFGIKKIMSTKENHILSFFLIKENRKYLINGCHFISKITESDIDKLTKHFNKYSKHINDIKLTEETKEEIKLSGTILFGDFNVNPFERPFNNPDGIFTFNCMSPLKSKTNITYYLNPTYSILGPFRTDKLGNFVSPGTYYFKAKDRDKPSQYYWNSPDGMLFSDELIKQYIDGQQLEIITYIIQNGNPKYLIDINKRKFKIPSDHLPIKFAFNI